MLRSGGYNFSSSPGRELNFVDTTFTAAPCDTTGSVTLLNGMTQGASASQRNGRQIQMKSLQITGLMSAGSTGTLAYGRCAVVLDLQANAALAAITDVYDAITTTTLRNISNMPRFRVLYDSGIVPIQGSSAAPNSGSSVSLPLYKKINIPVQYNVNSTGAIGDIQTGALLFLTWGLQTPGTTAASFTGRIRVRYEM